MLEEMGGKGTGDAASDDDDVCRVRQIHSRAVAEQYLGRLLVPVRLGGVGDGKAGLAANHLPYCHPAADCDLRVPGRLF